MFPNVPQPGVNPIVSDDGRHIATARIEFSLAGELVQLWQPVDGESEYEWRPIPVPVKVPE